MQRATSFVVAVSSAAWLSACGSDPAPPTVTIVSQAPAQLTVGVDEENDVSLRLGYEDGDADLGGGLLDVYDCRGDGVFRLPVPEVASPDVVEAGRPLSGELIALIPDIGAASGTAGAVCAGAPSDGSLVLCVELEDSSGHRSDAACSDPIAVAQP